MLILLRHLAAIALLPCVVGLVVPWWLFTSATEGDSRWADGGLVVGLVRAGGAALVVAGVLLFAWCVALFARVGRGTLAPWDPTRQLVAIGPYRIVRNPMISGVALTLAGQTLLWGSWRLGVWWVTFVVINHIYFVLVEEPGLCRRFGESYWAYAAQVPRWLPRLRP
ncbi:MAG: isoprenylcysteine carboxylmethyltransferase family protein [Gemmatimonadales bacterium]|jgi:protein-S-isoprenylcysteine O-methyltransferase Ste14|nr:isoprenylcysteine carboxylmethyltransferase family protein [Gemmatimonadales bacterium]MDQ3224864.1 isoprenylcysteine carboxylmethyltransferase family protein [Gemmatimonadota bacterium]